MGFQQSQLHKPKYAHYKTMYDIQNVNQRLLLMENSISIKLRSAECKTMCILCM